ncbi:MAG: hypothetical protein UY21_C0024G0001 [Microgenomates group bacterium GW2011_GWA1_48_10]|uniref:Uncharacterized protein n=1 Tax=Candidatus Gottesmanbacteria bacterium RIFCSPHIGHO2_01_FULL_47_48 TaxID=1798381 RepID=A0A1F6A540_9BACT|nr:MAG: hypothetical protein UY21_C0024G0001 [Microgenomates group bacterium GW2011_GWA1_48_10]OGG19835.1 MAG: hypothetical protein A2721_00430 [Candidatus Gottesmanbacteria bacterium RIFCSPHIGHO2_01_FULL_47_48]
MKPTVEQEAQLNIHDLEEQLTVPMNPGYRRQGAALRLKPEDSRPNWLKHILAHHLITRPPGVPYTEPRIEPDFDRPLNKLKIISSSLRFSSPTEVLQFQLLLTSITHFTLEFSYSKKFDVKDFTDEAIQWARQGINVANWFRAVTDLLCLDQIILLKIMSPKETVSEIVKMRGTKRRRIKQELNRVELIDLETTAIARKNKPLSEKETEGSQPHGVAALGLFEEFCSLTAKRLKSESERQDMQEIGPKLLSIAQAARESATFLNLLRESKYAPTEVVRPNAFSDVIPLIGFALGERLLGHTLTYQEGQNIINDLVHIFRRRRLGVFRANVLGFLAAFLPKEAVSANKISQCEIGTIDRTPVGPQHYIGDVLKAARAFAGDGFQAERIENQIKALAPDLLLQMRLQGLSDFKWSAEDYRTLGFSDGLFQRHENEVKRLLERKAAGLEMVQDGDAVIVYTGEFSLPTYAHVESALEAADLNGEELIHAGILPPSFKGKIWVLVAPNDKNPSKLDLEKDMDARLKAGGYEVGQLEMRRGMLTEALRHKENILFCPPDDQYGSTATRIRGYMENLGRRGVKACFIRLVGTDSYLHETEGVEFLDSLGHILMLQRQDLRDISSLHKGTIELMRRLPNNAVIWLAPILEHSSDFRGDLNSIDPDALLTLIGTPQILDKVVGIWGSMPTEEAIPATT